MGYPVDDQLLLNELLTKGAYFPVRATDEDPAVVWAHEGRLRLHFLATLLFANGASCSPALASAAHSPHLTSRGRCGAQVMYISCSIYQRGATSKHDHYRPCHSAEYRGDCSKCTFRLVHHAAGMV